MENNVRELMAIRDNLALVTSLDTVGYVRLQIAEKSHILGPRRDMGYILQSYVIALEHSRVTCIRAIDNVIAAINRMPDASAEELREIEATTSSNAVTWRSAYNNMIATAAEVRSLFSDLDKL